jgi:hypothetical protein
MCGKKTRVLSFFDNRNDHFLAYVSYMDIELFMPLNKHFSFYYSDYSKTEQGKYFMNHCEHCGALQGDHFLYSNSAFDKSCKYTRMLVTLPYSEETTFYYAGKSYGEMMMEMADELYPKPEKLSLAEYEERRTEYLLAHKPYKLITKTDKGV